MSWRWVSLTALLAALAVGFGALSRRETGIEVADTTLQQPAYYLEDAVITETQPDGSPRLRLIADRIEQQPGQGDFTLDSVRVDYLQVPDKQWFLSADRGLMPADARWIRFSGDVELRPLAGPAATFLRTDELTVDTETNLAYSTTSPVTMRFGNYLMTVKRFEADLKTEKIHMESVHGRSEAG